MAGASVSCSPCHGLGVEEETNPLWMEELASDGEVDPRPAAAMERRG